eukprot:10263737-Heterocapsa_arctica.AAC.1
MVYESSSVPASSSLEESCFSQTPILSGVLSVAGCCFIAGSIHKKERRSIALAKMGKEMSERVAQTTCWPDSLMTTT